MHLCKYRSRAFFGLFSVPSSDFETNVSLWHCWLRKLLRFRRQRWNNSGFFYSGSSMNKCNTASTRSGAPTFDLTCIETIVSFKRVTPIVKTDSHSNGGIVYRDGWRKQFFKSFPSVLTPNNLERQVLRWRLGSIFTSWQRIRTRDGWMRSANATSVLCHPPFLK